MLKQTWIFLHLTYVLYRKLNVIEHIVFFSQVIAKVVFIVKVVHLTRGRQDGQRSPTAHFPSVGDNKKIVLMLASPKLSNQVAKQK